jgi:hypothetical protein
MLGPENVNKKFAHSLTPFTLTRGLLSRYHDYHDMDMRTAAIPDPFEMVIQPTRGDNAFIVATFKEVTACGRDWDPCPEFPGFLI